MGGLWLLLGSWDLSWGSAAPVVKPNASRMTPMVPPMIAGLKGGGAAFAAASCAVLLPGTACNSAQSDSVVL